MRQAKKVKTKTSGKRITKKHLSAFSRDLKGRFVYKAETEAKISLYKQSKGKSYKTIQKDFYQAQQPKIIETSTETVIGVKFQEEMDYYFAKNPNIKVVVIDRDGVKYTYKRRKRAAMAMVNGILSELWREANAAKKAPARKNKGSTTIIPSFMVETKSFKDTFFYTDIFVDFSKNNIDNTLDDSDLEIGINELL